jgi:hypothetical protein
MRRLGGIVLLLALAAFSSCSDDGDDPVIRACKVIVNGCKKGDSVGSCIDDIGPLTADCLGCISGHGCDYATCQSDIPGCRLPGYMLDPKDRIDPGPRPPDAGAPDTGQLEPGPADAGSNG